MIRRRVILMAVLALGLSMAAREASAELLVGSSFTLVGTNAPDTFSESTTLAPGTTTIDSGALTLTKTIYNIGGGAQWLDLNFQTVGGGPLANDLGSTWQMVANGLQLSVPEFFTGFYLYYTLNRTAFNPIHQAPGFNLPVEPNPIDPALGPVFGTSYPKSNPQTTYNAYVRAMPYSAISSEGVDPNTANGFHMGIMVTAVPEPSTLSVAIVGVAGAGIVLARRRGNRRCVTPSI